MRWPLEQVYITQYWGENPDIYSRFGYSGHNGIDLRLHEGNGTPVYAPHNGVVKERRTDADGYGNYLKIENEIEGSILGHLQDWAVNINQQVNEGDLIAYGNNTGWSTGSHLHWGYYRFPRDRQNGYGGTINQLPFLDENDIMSVIYKGLDLTNQESMKVCVDMWVSVVEEGKYVSKVDVDHLKEDWATEKASLEERIKQENESYKKFCEELGTLLNNGSTEPEIKAELNKLINTEDLLNQCRNDKHELEKKITTEAAKSQEILDILSVECGVPVASTAGIRRALVAYLKANQANPELDSYTAYDLLKDLLRRMTSWLKRN